MHSCVNYCLCACKYSVCVYACVCMGVCACVCNCVCVHLCVSVYVCVWGGRCLLICIYMGWTQLTSQERCDNDKNANILPFGKKEICAPKGCTVFSSALRGRTHIFATLRPHMSIYSWYKDSRCRGKVVNFSTLITDMYLIKYIFRNHICLQ